MLFWVTTSLLFWVIKALYKSRAISLGDRMHKVPSFQDTLLPLHPLSLLYPSFPSQPRCPPAPSRLAQTLPKMGFHELP